MASPRWKQTLPIYWHFSAWEAILRLQAKGWPWRWPVFSPGLAFEGCAARLLACTARTVAPIPTAATTAQVRQVLLLAPIEAVNLRAETQSDPSLCRVDVGAYCIRQPVCSIFELDK